MADAQAMTLSSGPSSGDSTISVSDRQNQSAALDLMCAARWHYRVAKRWHGVRILGTVMLALAAPVVTFWVPNIADQVAAAAAGWVFVARLWLAELESRATQRAVTAQEEFDTRVFGLDWHTMLAGPHPAPEDILDAARRISTEERDEQIQNWYPQADAAPWPLNVVLCQWASATWARRAHQRTAVIFRVSAALWFVAGIGMGLGAGVDLAGYLVKLLLPSLPAFLDALDMANAHQRAGDQKERIEALADQTWCRGRSDASTVTGADCRLLQDHSYRFRLQSPHVGEWYYRLRRRRDEQIMRRAIERKLADRG